MRNSQEFLVKYKKEHGETEFASVKHAWDHMRYAAIDAGFCHYHNDEMLCTVVFFKDHSTFWVSDYPLPEGCYGAAYYGCDFNPR